MIRRILLTIVLLLVSAYLIVAVTAFNRKPKAAVCSDLELVIKDTVYAGFITKKEVLSMLRKEKLDPVGRDLDEVRTDRLEEVLSAHPLIDRVECYKTPSGKVCTEVSQRIPIMRVMSSRGNNYYLDNKGTIMPPGAKCVAHVPLATGHIEKSFAMEKLYKFGVFLQQNPFWDAQIEQIYICADQTVELVSRVGDHLIYLGELKDYDRKLDRLKEFYQKALNKVGWNKYSRINVEFDNQIICTKRD